MQLLHLGLRSPTPFLKTDPARDPDEYNPYMLAPSQEPAGEIPGGPTPKELEEQEIEYILQCFEEPRGAPSPPVSTASNFTSPTAICRGSSCRRSTTAAPIAGAAVSKTGCGFRRGDAAHSQANRRPAVLGYRINSTSFWEGDLEIDDVKRVHADFERVDIDYVSVSAGVHHSWIHTPMTFEEGWEREYTRAIKTVAKKPVLLGRPGQSSRRCRRARRSGDADAILLARQMIADEQWMTKVKQGRGDDIRRCVAANYCWRAVIRGSRVQCAYNPVVGREWGGAQTLKSPSPRGRW